MGKVIREDGCLEVDEWPPAAMARGSSRVLEGPNKQYESSLSLSVKS